MPSISLCVTPNSYEFIYQLLISANKFWYCGRTLWLETYWKLCIFFSKTIFWLWTHTYMNQHDFWKYFERVISHVILIRLVLWRGKSYMTLIVDKTHNVVGWPTMVRGETEQSKWSRRRRGQNIFWCIIWSPVHIKYYHMLTEFSVLDFHIWIFFSFFYMRKKEKGPDAV